MEVAFQYPHQGISGAQTEMTDSLPTEKSETGTKFLDVETSRAAWALWDSLITPSRDFGIPLQLLTKLVCLR